jgi:hypothetical protein
MIALTVYSQHCSQSDLLKYIRSFLPSAQNLAMAPISLSAKVKALDRSIKSSMC